MMATNETKNRILAYGNKASASFKPRTPDTVSGDTGDFADYPTLGIDANALYIGTNMFAASGAFADTNVFVVRKSSLLSGGPIVVTGFRGLITTRTGNGLFTPQGADNYDPAATEGYIVGVDNVTSTGSRIRLRRVSNPGATPTLSNNVSITVSSYAVPINVPHLGNTGGTANYIDCVDHRLMAAHFRNGMLWTCHNVGVNNTGGTSTVTRDGVRWYALTNIPTGSTPSVSQSDTVYQSSASNTSDQRSYWMGTVMVSGQGHAAMGFSAAGQNEYINAATCGRLASDATGTMQTPLLYTASSSAYNAPYNRWGDYSFTSVDPADDMTMWTIQEWCNSTNSYAVQAVKLLAPPPATPVSCSPASIAIGQTSVNVTVTGTQVSGSGFFDPGAGFANRLAAAVGGGVVVNSVTYTNPTTITLNLDTSAATPGADVVTVTNPDGQAVASGAGVLTVLGSPGVVSLSRANATPSNASSVAWTLTFSASVSGVTAGNFALAGTAANGAAVGTPTTADGGVTWSVPVSTGASSGSLTLSLANASGLSPTISTALPVAGQSYTMDLATQAPTLSAPTTHAITSSPIGVAFSLPETALAGSVQLFFGGTASRTLTLAASQETSGAHSFSFDPANPTLSAQIASISGGSSVPDGTYALALSYQDVLGNPPAAVTNTNILIDTTAPVVTPPANVTAEATSAAGAVVSYPPATATDAVGVVSLTYSQNSGITFPLGTTTVTATAKDAANNTGTATFTVTVRDTTAPALSLPSNMIAEATGPGGAAVTFAVSASDLVDGAVTATATPPSGSTFPLGVTTVNVTASDAADNTAHGSFTVTVSTAVTPLQSWRQLHFGTIENTGTAADTADPNSNGISNLLEYALGGDPLGNTTGTSILPQPGLSATQLLQFSFTRYPDRNDLTLTVQAADSLAGPWTDLAQSTAGTAFVALLPDATAAETGTGDTRNVTVTDLYPTSDPAHPQRFMRLQVTSLEAN